MTADSLLTTRDGLVTTVTINRPDVFNALDAEVIGGIRDVVLEAQRTSRVVIITGSGTKAFSAGADLKELAGMDADRAHRTMRAGQEAMRDIERSEIPVIAAVNGLALGGGFELVLAATFPVISTRAALGLPESGMGLIPGYGGTQRLPRAIGRRRATHLMLTGARLDAACAYELGITPLPPVEPDDLLPAARALADTIAAQGPLAVRAILRAVDRGADSTLDAGLGLETGLAALAVAGGESSEGVAAFLERRAPRFSDVEDADDDR